MPGLGDEIQAVLAEEHLAADEEGRDAEHAARDRGFGVGGQPCLDRGLLRAREEGGAVEAVRREEGCDHLRIVHLEAFLPHRAVNRVDIIVKIAFVLGDDRAAHDGQRVDGKMRIDAESDEAVLRDEAAHFEILICELRGRVGILDHRRLVARRLEDAAQKTGGDDEIGARAVEQVGKRLHREIGVGAAEVEDEFERFGHHFSPQGRRSSSCVQALLGCLWSIT